MKGRNLIFISLLILAIGVVLLLFHSNIDRASIVTVGGVLFILAGFFNILVFDRTARKKQKSGEREHAGMVSTSMSWISSGAAVILGVCMLVFKSTFLPLVPVMFGILIAFAAFYQLYILAVGVRPVVLPAWLYFAPLLVAIGAAYLFFQKGDAEDVHIIVATSVSLIIFGIAGIIEGVMLGSENRLMRKEGVSDPVEARRLRNERLKAKESAGAPDAPLDDAPAAQQEVADPAGASEAEKPEPAVPADSEKPSGEEKTDA